MLGDIYLFIKYWLKQQFCIHEYNYYEFGIKSYGICRKCGRVK